MKIQNANFYNSTVTPKQKPFYNFKGLKSDVFEKSSTPDRVIIKDLNDNDVEAKIIEKTSNNNMYNCNEITYIMEVDNFKLGYAKSIFDDNSDYKYRLLELYTEEDQNRHYKNAGTELLKCVVKNSIKNGCKGRVKVTASHCPAPFAFYYLNNFRVPQNINPAPHKLQRFNAPIEYTVRKNVPISDVLWDYMTTLPMEIDEKGAKAFLEGRKLYLERTFKTIAQETIDSENYSVNFIQSPHKNEYFFQLINENADKNKQVIIVVANIKKENNKKTIKFIDEDETYATEKEYDLIKKTIGKFCKENNILKTDL